MSAFLTVVQNDTSQNALYSVLLEHTGPDFLGQLTLDDLEQLSGVADCLPILLKLESLGGIDYLEVVDHIEAYIVHWGGAVSYERSDEFEEYRKFEQGIFDNHDPTLEKVVDITDGIPF